MPTAPRTPPAALVLGKAEAQAQRVAVRQQGGQEETSLEAAVQQLAAACTAPV